MKNTVREGYQRPQAESICIQCGKTFSYERWQRNRKFCSHPCSLRYSLGKERIFHLSSNCVICGKEIRPTRTAISKGYAKKCCSVPCTAELFHRRFLVRLEKQIKKTDTCWIWEGKISKRGYGITTWYSKTVIASRLMYEEKYGKIPDGLYACHKCDNRACVNPDHIFLGTSSDNQQDMVRKGRSNFGAKHPHAKLNDAQVLEIRKLLKENGSEKSYLRSLARSYDVSLGSIQGIHYFRTWKHLKDNITNA